MKTSARAVVVAVALVLAAGLAMAAPPANEAMLSGDYAFTGTSTCLASPGGFDSSLNPITPPFPHTFTFSVQGIRTFRGDGTGHVVGRSVGVNQPYTVPSHQLNPYTPSYNRGVPIAGDFEAEFTYSVDSDGTVTINNVWFTGTNVAGFGTGSSRIPDFPPLVGQLSQDHKTLVIGHVLPAVETIIATVNGVDDHVIEQRICPRSRVLIRK